uniref:Secreted protein n=1 Tax=Pyxicephalus adspersus TaxID=30357 RepID=A0AAV2ZNU4_PYXAD|nr:TPA: hypothetical protein GDO54_002707 [Pyxicephalus adspersus]
MGELVAWLGWGLSCCFWPPKGNKNTNFRMSRGGKSGTTEATGCVGFKGMDKEGIWEKRRRAEGFRRGCLGFEEPRGREAGLCMAVG